MFSILGDPKFTFTFYDLENENGSGFGFDICNFYLWYYQAIVWKPESSFPLTGSLFSSWIQLKSHGVRQPHEEILSVLCDRMLEVGTFSTQENRWVSEMSVVSYVPI